MGAQLDMRASKRRRPRQGGTQPPEPTSPPPDLTALGQQLERLQHRVRRLRRRVHPGSDTVLWARWSGAVAETAALCERIAKLPASDLADLAVKCRAMIWELVEDDVILDRVLRRRVIRFGRELDAMSKRLG